MNRKLSWLALVVLVLALWVPAMAGASAPPCCPSCAHCAHCADCKEASCPKPCPAHTCPKPCDPKSCPPPSGV